VQQDRPLESIDRRGEEAQPVRRIEELVRGVRGQRLAGGDERVPVRELAAANDVVQDRAEGEVVEGDVAGEEDAVAENDVEEEERNDGGEAAGGEQVVPPRPAHARAVDGEVAPATRSRKIGWLQIFFLCSL
jgi:hypothetical protein